MEGELWVNWVSFCEWKFMYSILCQDLIHLELFCVKTLFIWTILCQNLIHLELFCVKTLLIWNYFVLKPYSSGTMLCKDLIHLELLVYSPILLCLLKVACMNFAFWKNFLIIHTYIEEKGQWIEIPLWQCLSV